MGRRSNDEKARERRARMVDPIAWAPPLRREKDLRRLKARDRVRKLDFRNQQLSKVGAPMNWQRINTALKEPYKEILVAVPNPEEDAYVHATAMWDDDNSRWIVFHCNW